MIREFIQPKGFLDLTTEEFSSICNGAGSAQHIDLVPDTMYFMNMNEAANIHDYMYYKGYSRFDKIVADAVYLYNMFYLIEQGSYWFRFLRKRRAIKYAFAVNYLGDGSFFLKEKDNILYENFPTKSHKHDWSIIKKFIKLDYVSNDNYISILEELCDK